MKYFFDTNVISRLVKKESETIQKIQALATDETSEFYINRLVYMESLRAIPMTRTKLYCQTKATLESFEKLDITQDIYDESVKFARFCKSKGLSFGKCEAIDYIYFITAKKYQLQVISFDQDMETMEAKHVEFLESDIA